MMTSNRFHIVHVLDPGFFVQHFALMLTCAVTLYTESTVALSIRTIYISPHACYFSVHLSNIIMFSGGSTSIPMGIGSGVFVFVLIVILVGYLMKR